MTVKKITRVGNSQAIVLDKHILAQMGLSEGGEVQITLHGQQLVITPVHPNLPDDRFQESLDRVLDKYDDLFRRLA